MLVGLFACAARRISVSCLACVGNVVAIAVGDGLAGSLDQAKEGVGEF